MQKDVIEELLTAYPTVTLGERDDLMDVLIKISTQTGEKFICVIDEWDAVLREYENDNKTEDDFVKLLRRLFKGDESKKVFAGVYMTGILPIKKYKYDMPFDELEKWYDGYKIGNEESIFNPNSVINAVIDGECDC